MDAIELPDIYQKILLKLGKPKDVIGTCKTNKLAWDFCKDPTFWLVWIRKHKPSFRIHDYLELLFAVREARNKTVVKTLTNEEFLQTLALRYFVFEEADALFALLTNSDDIRAYFKLDGFENHRDFINEMLLDIDWELVFDNTEFWREWSKRGLLNERHSDWSSVEFIFNTYPKAKPFENDEVYHRFFNEIWMHITKPETFATWKAFLRHAEGTKDDKLIAVIQKLPVRLTYFPYYGDLEYFFIFRNVGLNQEQTEQIMDALENTDEYHIENMLSNSVSLTGFLIYEEEPSEEDFQNVADLIRNTLDFIIG